VGKIRFIAIIGLPVRHCPVSIPPKYRFLYHHEKSEENIKDLLIICPVMKTEVFKLTFIFCMGRFRL
jgi:hypothetical protein